MFGQVNGGKDIEGGIKRAARCPFSSLSLSLFFAPKTSGILTDK